MKMVKTTSACAMLLIGLLAAATLTASAQGRGDDHDHDHDHGHGHGRALGHYKHFNDHDRDEVRDWEGEHRGHWPRGFREDDHWSPELEAQLRVGVVLVPALRERIEPAPRSLVVLLTPPPPDYRYIVLGDHVCLVDRGLRVADVLHLEIGF